MSPKPAWKGGGGLAEGIGIRFGAGEARRSEREQEEATVGEAIIVDAVRTARGKRKGALAALHPVDLLARTLTGALDRAGVNPEDVDDVIMGASRRWASRA